MLIGLMFNLLLLGVIVTQVYIYLTTYQKCVLPTCLRLIFFEFVAFQTR